MVTLYHAPGACSLAPHTVLEWIGRPYEAKRVEFGDPDYLKISWPAPFSDIWRARRRRPGSRSRAASARSPRPSAGRPSPPAIPIRRSNRCLRPPATPARASRAPSRTCERRPRRRCGASCNRSRRVLPGGVTSSATAAASPTLMSFPWSAGRRTAGIGLQRPAARGQRVSLDYRPRLP